jgi:hypothetical protein
MKQPLSLVSPEREAARQTRSYDLTVNRLVSRQGRIIEILFRLSTARGKKFHGRDIRAISQHFG